MKTTCRYYDPENGWCRLKSSWKDSMPEIVECEAGGCAEFEEEKENADTKLHNKS